MQIKTKLQESEEMQEFLALKIQKDLEAKLIADLIEKLQILEKKIVEEEETKKLAEEIEEETLFLEYGLVESFYSKDKGAYQVKQPYEKKD